MSVTILEFGVFIAAYKVIELTPTIKAVNGVVLQYHGKNKIQYILGDFICTYTYFFWWYNRLIDSEP